MESGSFVFLSISNSTLRGFTHSLKVGDICYQSKKENLSYAHLTFNHENHCGFVTAVLFLIISVNVDLPDTPFAYTSDRKQVTSLLWEQVMLRLASMP